MQLQHQPSLFANIHCGNSLGFWEDDEFQPKQVVEFLSLDKNDVSKIAGVSKQSVRYDRKIPQDVIEHLEQIANVCGLVAEYFDNDVRKTALWFQTPNPLLGSESPRDMIRVGRYKKLLDFIMEYRGS